MNAPKKKQRSKSRGELEGIDYANRTTSDICSCSQFWKLAAVRSRLAAAYLEGYRAGRRSRAAR